MKILIGYDGSSCGDAALVDLKQAGLPRDAEAIIISLADVVLPLKSGDEFTDKFLHSNTAVAVLNARKRSCDAVQVAEKLSEKAKDIVKTTFPNWNVQAQADGDSPAWGIIKRAIDWKADLIVVGSHGRSALGRVIFGSVSQKVLNNSPSSVRIARGNPLERISPIRIIVGIDGSINSEKAVCSVVNRSWPSDTQVCLVSVIDQTSDKAFHYSI